ncbi:hypothetical protein A3B36_01820 [Candidatus Uhrbacteria bacterium RIFCSPLOWO2_01_FULL_55_36]|uniref:Uncharacterized protein n=1 Tax=Candidatus Uhrbacteria bacterium RIFCSPLOWO2_01_FULL_55_36 TaxID=1802404 RepID=A0A1F7V144_9BACT|nr:MAG: hypothetical protein A3B36_01820 [Candidatus Uhrbacteria bacterium RIFCSPLOWO2_01_FULL_55_36]
MNGGAFYRSKRFKYKRAGTRRLTLIFLCFCGIITIIKFISGFIHVYINRTSRFNISLGVFAAVLVLMMAALRGKR